MVEQVFEYGRGDDYQKFVDDIRTWIVSNPDVVCSVGADAWRGFTGEYNRLKLPDEQFNSQMSVYVVERAPRGLDYEYLSLESDDYDLILRSELSEDELMNDADKRRQEVVNRVDEIIADIEPRIQRQIARAAVDWTDDPQERNFRKPEQGVSFTM